MTVKELIEELKKQPQDYKVMVNPENCEHAELCVVKGNETDFDWYYYDVILESEEE